MIIGWSHWCKINRDCPPTGPRLDLAARTLQMSMPRSAKHEIAYDMMTMCTHAHGISNVPCVSWIDVRQEAVVFVIIIPRTNNY